MADGAPGSHDRLEDAARQRVVELGDEINLDTFAAAFALFRVSTKVISDLEVNVHRKLGLSIAGFRVLFTVWVFESLEPREIARLSGVTRAAVSGVVKTLEGQGLAVRTKDQADGRLVTVRITAEGEARLRETYQAQNRREADIFASLTPEELESFTEIMRKLLRSPLPESPDS